MNEKHIGQVSQQKTKTDTKLIDWYQQATLLLKCKEDLLVMSQFNFQKQNNMFCFKKANMMYH